MDAVTGVSVAKGAAELSKKLWDWYKEQKDAAVKERISALLDELNELKQQAAEQEDEIRKLREQARFSGDEFVFRSPYYYEQGKQQPLCPKCFAGKVAAPMGPVIRHSSPYRICLVCEKAVDEPGGVMQLPEYNPNNSYT